MLALKKVAITGGISCGKSTVCRILRQHGACVVSADRIVHQLLSSNLSVKTKVIRLLGPEIKTGSRIDRKKVARLVFAHPKKLKALEKILHPFVKKKIKEIYNQVKNVPSYIFFVAEIPLLYEIKMENFFDFVIAVIADTRVTTARFIKKHKSTKKEFLKRMKQQASLTQKMKKADYVLMNNGSCLALKKHVDRILAQLKES